jgi:hypothetical protein
MPHNGKLSYTHGTHLCTDLGTALLLEVNEKRLTIVGFFSYANPGASITLNIDNPKVGTFDLVEGQYSPDDESTSIYYVVDKEFGEGSGSVTITKLTDTFVTGTFEFTAIGIDDSTDNPNGDKVKVSNGTFYFVLENNYY